MSKTYMSANGPIFTMTKADYADMARFLDADIDLSTATQEQLNKLFLAAIAAGWQWKA